jgi:hypothetical protein
MAKRALTAEENQLMQKGLNQWFGKIFPNMGTELWQLMSNPLKRASVAGHSMGAFAGAVTGYLANAGVHSPDVKTLLATIGASLALGLPAAWLAKESVEQHNGNLKDSWQRLPNRPTYRDYLSDAVSAVSAPIGMRTPGQIAEGAGKGLTALAAVGVGRALGRAGSK